jgi:hypothetical protein
MDQLILFHKPYKKKLESNMKPYKKKLESNMMMDHFVPQTKHPLIVLALNLSVAQEKAYCIALICQTLEVCTQRQGEASLRPCLLGFRMMPPKKLGMTS